MEPYQQIAEALKKQLKAQKIPQIKLAAMMNVPSSTVKKWLNAEDGSFNRLDRICHALGISLAGLVRSLEKREVIVLSFTGAQEQYFQRHAQAFHIYWLLVYERYPFDKICADLRIKSEECKRVLYQFDKLGLIDVLPQDRLRLPAPRPIRWRPEGNFVERVFRDWSMGILSEALKAKDDLILQFFQVSEDSAKEFYQDLRRLEEKYARRTIQEMTAEASTRKIRFVAGTAEGSFFKKGS